MREVFISLGREGRRRYAHCLIDCSTLNNHWGIVSLSFGKDVTKMRIKNIISYKKNKKGMLTAMALIVCLIAVLFMTARASANDTTAEPKRPEVQQGEIECTDANGKDVSIYMEASDAFSRLDTILSGDSTEFENFRTGYAGGYITDKGILVVGQKGVQQEELDRVKKAADLKNVRFVEAAYTYRELEQAEKTICKYLQNVYKVNPNTTEVRFTTAINQEYNCIDIELTPVEDEELSAIQTEFEELPCRITMKDVIWMSEELALRQ